MAALPKGAVVINNKGQWLNGDAAASYLRILPAGCPAGGISDMGAGRTRAEQEILYAAYKRGGNLAAKPGTSLHERGNALDISRGTAAQLWMVVGGDPYNAKAGEKIRANAYGWVRTVNKPGRSNEPWHFAYDRSKDTKRAADLKARLKALGFSGVKAFQRSAKLTADGVDGPLTWAALLSAKPKPAPAPTPTPTPVDPTTEPTLARIGTLNCDAMARPKMTAKQITALVDLIGRISPSMIALTDCPAWLRDHLRGVCSCKPGTHKTVGDSKYWRVAIRSTSYSQAILFDNRKWTLRGSTVAVEFGPTSRHGGLIARFAHAASKAEVTVGAYHLPPDAVSSLDYQRKALARLIALMPTSGARILAGDGSNESGWAPGWDDARIVAATSSTRSAPTYSKSVRDRIHVKGITVRGYEVIPSNGASDHNGVLAQITIPAAAVSPL